jgi:monothiol glutaredoxin
MPRLILAPEHTHPAAQAIVERHQVDLVLEVEAACASHPLVIVGMRGNPFCRRARRAAAAAGLEASYLEYGSYLSGWRRRNALKMWTGWPTFPMVFAGGVLVGGHDQMVALIASGELQRMLG